MKDGLYEQLFSHIDDAFASDKSGRLDSADVPYEPWLKCYFPRVCTYPLAPRHHGLWQWIDALTPGVRPKPRVEVWSRGGGKSSTVELGVARVGARLSRRFGLYICDTQDQADKHVQSIATLFESLGVERAVNKYGNSRGWRRDQLRTANGFNVAALGLDVASRGIKLDQYRPDFIIFDDIDAQLDSLETIDKKIKLITGAIIPAGSEDVAILFMQNLPNEDGIVAQLADNRADFLHDREPANVEPAVIGLKYETVENSDGPNTYKIIAGEATWEGQSIATCEAQLNAWGLRAFLREAQHKVKGADGYFFNTEKLTEILPGDVPNLRAVCMGVDLAATEGGGDHSVLSVTGVDYAEKFYRLAMIRGQWSSDRVREAIRLATAHYKALYPGLRIKLPQDPGQAGKAQASGMRKEMPGATIQVVTGKKWTRATNFAEQVNLGNYFMVCEDLPDFLVETRNEETEYKTLVEDRSELSWKAWHRAEREELRKFKEGVLKQVDDIVDADSDAHNELGGRRLGRVA